MPFGHFLPTDFIFPVKFPLIVSVVILFPPLYKIILRDSFEPVVTAMFTFFLLVSLNLYQSACLLFFPDSIIPFFVFFFLIVTAFFFVFPLFSEILLFVALSAYIPLLLNLASTRHYQLYSSNISLFFLYQCSHPF